MKNNKITHLKPELHIAQEEMGNITQSGNLYEFSRELILNSRKLVYQTANFAMVETYWRIGEKIVEEQGGAERAKYGDELIAGLSEKLTAEFGKGFTIRNIWAMRQFYMQFPILHALRAELSWTHYRLLFSGYNRA
jgi:ABC-type Fe3+-citrate transport system substrate-binding protein